MDVMQASAEKIGKIYEKFDAADRFEVMWYDVPHSLNVEMQYHAIRWLELWLKNMP